MKAVARTQLAIETKWAGDRGRQNQGVAFIKRAQRSDQRRKQAKASRRRNR